MAEFTTRDGTQIFFKDWGAGQPIVFSHGWPLSSDDPARAGRTADDLVQAVQDAIWQPVYPDSI